MVVNEFDGDQLVDTFYHKGEQVRSARANQTLCLRNGYLHTDVYHNIHVTIVYLNLP